MRAETEKKLNKIRRVSGVVRGMCRGGLVVMGLIFVAACVGVLAGGDVTIRCFDVVMPTETMGLSGRLIVIGMLAISAGVLGKIFYHLDRLFGNYASGEIFTISSAHQIRQLGIVAILWTGVSIMWPVGEIWLLHTAWSFQSHFDSLFAGVVILVISWFMEAAAEIREENELTI